LQALNFRPWGFMELAIDQQKLSDGEFAISRASGIFPEGLLFDIPSSDPAPGSKSLADHIDAEHDTLDVYLAVPEYRQRGLNVSLSQKNTGTRYVAALEMFRDENTGVTEKPVQVARKNFRIQTAGRKYRANRGWHVSREPSVCAAAAVDYRQRISDDHASRIGRDSSRQEQRSGWIAPPEESEPGRLQR
jgi:type VI secretion system protein ImpJ